MAKIDDSVKKELKALGKTEALDMLEWILNQERLRIEVWYHERGEKSARVWTICDEEDFPSGRGASVLEALQLAKEMDERI